MVQPAEEIRLYPRRQNQSRNILPYQRLCELAPEEKLRVEFDLGSDRLGRRKAVNIKSVGVGVGDEQNHN